MRWYHWVALLLALALLVWLAAIVLQWLTLHP
jgi:hypothetical protein